MHTIALARAKATHAYVLYTRTINPLRNLQRDSTSHRHFEQSDIEDKEEDNEDIIMTEHQKEDRVSFHGSPSW